MNICEILKEIQKMEVRLESYRIEGSLDISYNLLMAVVGTLLFLLLFFQFANISFYVALGLCILIITIILICFFCYRVQFGTLQFSYPRYFSILIYGLIFTFSLSLALLLTVQTVSKFSTQQYIEFFKILLPIHVTIISIIMAVTILAIQLTTEKYSQRIVELFKEYFDFTIISIIYFSAILLDLWIIFGNQYFLFIPLLFPPVALSIGIFAILSILPYFWLILILLRPENLVQFLGLAFKANEPENSSAKVLTILDLMLKSIINYEFMVFEVGYSVICKKVNKKLIDDKDPDMLSRWGCDRWLWVVDMMITKASKIQRYDILFKCLYLELYFCELQTHCSKFIDTKPIRKVGDILSHPHYSEYGFIILGNFDDRYKIRGIRFLNDKIYCGSIDCFEITHYIFDQYFPVSIREGNFDIESKYSIHENLKINTLSMVKQRLENELKKYEEKDHV